MFSFLSDPFITNNFFVLFALICSFFIGWFCSEFFDSLDD